MPAITANIPLNEPAHWAVWQRRLFDALDQSVQPFLDHFTREDGEFIWQDEWGGGSPDDFYEPFFNWPLVYLMGGGEHLLHLADRQWEAITRQLTRLGTVSKEYGIREDQMHQAESDICFYHLCLAHPNAPRRVERALPLCRLLPQRRPRSAKLRPRAQNPALGPQRQPRPLFRPAGRARQTKLQPLGRQHGSVQSALFRLAGHH